MAEFELTDAEYDAATRRGKQAGTGQPRPSSVHFDSETGRIVVEFINGAAFMVPARSLQGLEMASDAELGDVEILGDDGLHWEALDADFTIAGLMAGVFGTRSFVDVARKGGKARSAAKIAASRANGAKGGRPRKAAG
ncbi:DUF2442 domain-containing protein [Aurantimonas marianensis]|uniref:DUF2442 domain-containing protein n=1 Tax=Aurantimonas marianensis TaxID=2920428 RepID=A0A9X2KFS4_9HYPH|nr:DUF2442 domain-containing protein [Aurantimonas marianensis]MCP3056813.1 DUF2442 domain-containing protein [Aurantimonas marianensis]